VPKAVKVLTSGSFKNSLAFLQRMKSREYLRALGPKYGPAGVAALAQATPVEYGTTADSWYFEIVDKPGYYSIHWLNSNVVNPGNIPVAVLIQYGHATGNGAYVEGYDYINPALKPIFDQIAADMWKEVTK
jgi:hypothetical protein